MGDYYFDSKKKKCKRAFNVLILAPLRRLIKTIMDGKDKKYEKMLRGIGVWDKMQSQCKDELSKVQKPKDLLKIALKTWLPAGDTLLNMYVNIYHLLDKLSHIACNHCMVEHWIVKKVKRF